MWTARIREAVSSGGEATVKDIGWVLVADRLKEGCYIATSCANEACIMIMLMDERGIAVRFDQIYEDICGNTFPKRHIPLLPPHSPCDEAWRAATSGMRS